MTSLTQHAGLQQGSGPAAPTYGLELCLLSLDGGGVRGLSSLLILKQIMESIDPTDPPKPCDYFDMICGTSTGGLIAIMLGRMRLTVDECIAAYTELASEVFTKVQHRIKINGKVQGRFNHKALEKGIQNILVKYGFRPDELMKSPPQTGACKTFVCATSKQTAQTVVLSSYYNARRGTDILNNALIWEVARATSAATSFFESIAFDDEGFVDGATGANNPISQLWTEAGDTWGEQLHGSSLEENIRCIVSIGTGIPSLHPFGDDPMQIGKALLAIATDTEQEADLFHKHHSLLYRNARAFRFNVLRGLENIGLEEAARNPEIKAATRAYIQSEEVFLQVKRCSTNLREREWLKQLLPPILQHAKSEILSLNDPKNIISQDTLQWLTHTNCYDSWLSKKNALLWYRMSISPSTSGDEKANVARSISASICDHYSPFFTYGFKPRKLMRAMYFRFSSESDVEPPDSQNAHLNIIAKILWSLICQALLLDCDVQERLQRKILELIEHDRNSLQSGLHNIDATSPLLLFGLLRRVIAMNSNIEVLSVEGVDALSAVDVDILIPNLKSILYNTPKGEKDLGHIRLFFTGASNPALTICLKGATIIEDNTEFKGDSGHGSQHTNMLIVAECLMSLHFKEWNTRRNQVADADTGTNKWVWNHAAYRSWEAETSGILWIEGKPGSGKSVLAKSIQRVFAQSLRRSGTGFSSISDPTVSSRSGPYALQVTQSKGPLIGDFFYSVRMGDRGILHTYLLRSVLYQLLGQDESLFQYFLTLYRTLSIPIDFEWQHNWSEHDTMEIFKQISSAGVAVICIVDAMDESKEIKPVTRGTRGSTILATLSKLVMEIPNSRLKFIVLSRPDPFLELDFRKVQHKFSHTHQITLEWNNEGDIKLIVQRGLGYLRSAMHVFDSDDDEPHRSLNTKGLSKRKKDPIKYGNASSELEEKQLERIRVYLLQHANGVILWVTLIISDLETFASKGMFTFRELEERLLTLPTELDELYAHMVRGMQQRLSMDDFQKARSTLMLVSGSGILNRPIRLRELWDALAVPDDIAIALKSEVDPIKQSRIPISTWTSFRRQLRQKCGSFIEVLRDEHDESADIQEGNEGLGPEQTVQLIHRTVKDFLETAERAGPLHFSENTAVDSVHLLVKNFSAIAFPSVATLYAPSIPVAQTRNWHHSIEIWSEYLNERILLTFAFAISSGHEAEILGPYSSFFETSVDPPIKSLNEDAIKAKFGAATRLYPWSAPSSYTGNSALTAVIGYYFQYCCGSGLSTAVRNLFTITALPDQKVCRKLRETIANGALLAAIENNLPAKVDVLTRNNRHRGNFINPEWRGTNLDVDSRNFDPFLQFALKAGHEEICMNMFDETAKFCSSQNRVYVRTVSTPYLQDLSKPDNTTNTMRDKVLDKVKQMTANTPSVGDLNDVEEAIQLVIDECEVTATRETTATANRSQEDKDLRRSPYEPEQLQLTDPVYRVRRMPSVDTSESIITLSPQSTLSLCSNPIPSLGNISQVSNHDDEVSQSNISRGRGDTKHEDFPTKDLAVKGKSVQAAQRNLKGWSHVKSWWSRKLHSKRV